MKLFKGEYVFVFALHAVFRARERNIDGQTLEHVVHTGRFEKFGDRGVKVIGKTKKGEIILVGRFVKDNLVKIVTVEKSE